MKKSLLAALPLLALGAVSLAPSVAFADVSFNVGAITDYRYRGISQTRLKPALQGGADFSEGGFYLGVWASTIKWIKDAPPGDASVEIDLYGGYKGELAKDVGYDVGVLAYVYPSNNLSPSANTTELYGALTFGPVTAKYSHSVTNLFGFAKSKNSGYFDLSANFDMGDGFTLTPHLGYQRVDGNKTATYTDYSVTVAKDMGAGLTLSAALIGASVKKVGGVPAYVSPSGKNLGRSGLVVGVKYAF
jgi:uncharacterized protein (TIGR02001 family)